MYVIEAAYIPDTSHTIKEAHEYFDSTPTPKDFYMLVKTLIAKNVLLDQWYTDRNELVGQFIVNGEMYFESVYQTFLIFAANAKANNISIEIKKLAISRPTLPIGLTISEM